MKLKIKQFPKFVILSHKNTLSMHAKLKINFTNVKFLVFAQTIVIVGVNICCFCQWQTVKGIKINLQFFKIYNILGITSSPIIVQRGFTHV